MSDIPAALVEAAARAQFERDGGVGYVTTWDALHEVGRDQYRDDARAVLAAAFAECEVTEFFGHSDVITGNAAHWRDPHWHRHECPTSDRRCVVITTSPVVVTPAQEG